MLTPARILACLCILAASALRADAPQSALAIQAAAATQPASLIVWDGEAHNIGGGWVDHKDKETLKPQDTEAHSGKTALVFTGDGDKWHGCGWNWTQWQAAKAVDTTPYTSLVFWVKITGTAKPKEFKVCLASTIGNKISTHVEVSKYCRDLFDGQWHQVFIPLAELTAKAKDFDAAKAWEIEFGNWNNNPVTFQAYFDDIGFTNEPAK